MEEERQVKFEVYLYYITQDAEKFANEIGSFYIETSAKKNINVEKLFDEIANKLPKFSQISDIPDLDLKTDKNENDKPKCKC